MSWRIDGDWGTSRLRLFRREGGHVVDRRDGPGIGALDAPPADVLRAAIAAWRAEGDPGEIRLCGMVGSRNGWIEAPYADCPIGRSDWAGQAVRLSLDGIPARIAAGLACERDDGAPDVMRGEETQIFGAIALDPALAAGTHLIALPGTHGKWARIEDGRIRDFRTFFTGELFALLAERSTLLRAGDAAASDGADEAEGFEDGLARAETGPPLTGALFEARARQLRSGRSAGWARGFLSGLLIGEEVAAAAGAATDVSTVRLIGDRGLTARYERALARRGIAAARLDGEACALAGLDLLGGAW